MASPTTYDVSTLTVDEFFGYTPSLALAYTAMALFVLAAIIVAGQVLYHKNARYMWTVAVTGILEAGGYAAMVYITKKSGQTDIYGGCVTPSLQRVHARC